MGPPKHLVDCSTYHIPSQEFIDFLTKSANMSHRKIYSLDPETAFRFLDLPLEMRRKIYRMMRQWPSSQHHAVLQTSKQICIEAKESFDQRGMVCASQLELFDKVLSTPSFILQTIPTLVVTFEPGICRMKDSRESRKKILESSQDLLEVDGWSCVCCDQDRRIDCVLEDDLQAIMICLSRLPKLVDLEIKRCTDTTYEQEYNNYYSELACWFEDSATRISSLKISAVQIHLWTVCGFEHLVKLDIFSHSCTKPDEMAEVFQDLIQLEDLTVRTPMGSIHNYLMSVGDTEEPWHVSINEGAIRALKSLKRLALYDPICLLHNCYVNSYSQLPRQEILAGLRAKHANTLEHLTLYVTRRFDAHMFEDLCALLEPFTSLKTLDLSMILGESPDFTKLPRTLQKLQIQTCDLYFRSLDDASLDLVHKAFPDLEEFDLTVIRYPDEWPEEWDAYPEQISRAQIQNGKKSLHLASDWQLGVWTEGEGLDRYMILSPEVDTTWLNQFATRTDRKNPPSPECKVLDLEDQSASGGDW